MEKGNRPMCFKVAAGSVGLRVNVSETKYKQKQSVNVGVDVYKRQD